jgi:glyceraldehyde 3-phosphate dehydrogenase
VAVRVAINGFGRIGRLVFRNLVQRSSEFEVVAINDLTDNRTLATLLKYDSVHRRFDGTVDYNDKFLIVNGKEIHALAERDPEKLPWKEWRVDVVLESTGIFTKRRSTETGKAGYDSHLVAGARKVVLSAPASDAVDLTCVLGVNDHLLSPKHLCVSNASCTTNCLAPVAKVLHDTFGIEKGLMTTIHSYTNDQQLLDLPHKDLYRTRAAALNMIPTSTGAAKAVGLVIPDLAGKLTGIAIRVPTPTGSMVDLTAVIKNKATKESINAAMKAASETSLEGIMQYCTDPIVSSDVIGNPYSSIFVPDWTYVIGDNLVKVVAWYDNEWGYSCRAADLIQRVGKN